MAKTIFYRQCHLRKKVEKGDLHTTTYLPEKFAVVGECVKLKNEDGSWTNGWVVDSASESRISDVDLPDSHKAIKEHRKATGDSMPKLKTGC